MIKAWTAYHPTAAWSKMLTPKNATAPANTPTPSPHARRAPEGLIFLDLRAMPAFLRAIAIRAINNANEIIPPVTAHATYQFAVSHMSKPQSAFAVVPNAHHSPNRLMHWSTN